MLYLIQGTGLVLALITLINADLDEDCPPELNDLVLTPPELVVEYGTSFSVSCSSSNITNVTWGDELEQFVVNQAIYIDNLTDWELQPVCYMNLDGVECKKAVQMTIYKFPDLVSISTVNHTGPMTAGGQYELRCDVHNVTPVHLLTVNWYKDLFLVDSTNVTDIRNKLPDSWSTTLQISPSIEDQGVEYKCEAMLNLGPKGPAFNTYTSEPLNIHLSTQSYNCSELALDPPELVVRYGDPASVSCRSLSIYTDLGWRVPQGNVSTPVEQSVTWRTNNVSDWGIEPVCYMMRDGVECAKFLPITIYKLPDQVSISVVNHTGPLVVDKKYDLQCDIQNFAPLHALSVSWYHGDQLLKHRGFSNISTKTPSNKTVTMRIKVRRDDVQFSCAAKLKVGPSPPIVKSNLLKISVHYKPVINCLNWSPMINSSLKSYPYNVRGNPSPNITWYREDELLSPDMRLSRNDSGRYTLLASNVMGDTSCVTNITVEYAPIFNCPTNYEGKENDNFKDECLVAASPEAKVTWEKSGRMVNPLHHLTRGDSGVYVITAVNKHGTVRHHLTVNVLHGPEIQQFTGFKVVIVGNDVSLNCTAIGNPVPEVKWSFQNQTKTTARRQTILQISDVKSENVGEYTCTATNTHGSQNATVFLTVKERQTGMISIILVLSIVFICIVLFIIYLYVKKKRSGKYNIQTNGTLAMSLLNHSHGKGTANS